MRLHGAGQTGVASAAQLPAINFSIVVQRLAGEGHCLLHPKYVAAVLNDVYGIQVRMASEKCASATLPSPRAPTGHVQHE